MARPIPHPDALTAPYWEATRRGRFELPRCRDCERFHFYPRPACPHCGSERIAWAAASGRGRVYSFSVVHRAPSPAFKGETPYVVAVVETAEGPHLLTRLVDRSPEAARVGLGVQVRFDQIAEEVALPVFAPSEDVR